MHARDSRESREFLERLVTPVIRARKVGRDYRANPVCRVLPVTLVNPVSRVTRVLWAQKAKEAQKALKAPRVRLPT